MKLLYIFRSIACGAALALALHSAATADDTEILVGASLPSGTPNIIFLLDTSGSMGTKVVVGTGYDATTSYTGTCDKERFYWASDGSENLPDCAGSLYIEPSAMRCQAAIEAFATAGRFRDRYAQWNPTEEPPRWRPLIAAGTGLDPAGELRLTECRTDAGVHGDNDGAGLYAANGIDGPWTELENQALDWRSTGSTYTFYSGNFLNWIQQEGEENTLSTRMDELKKVMQNVLSTLTGVNTSVMRFSTNSEGGMVLHAMAPTEANVDSLLQSINSLQPEGTTPLAETLLEARQYYAGDSVVYGIESTVPSGPQPSVPESRNADTYISPIELQCQRNYVVLLTDGFPQSDTDGNQAIESLPGFTQSQGTCSESCLDELSRYLAEVDQVPGIPGEQLVQTYTIGFHTDQPLLLASATAQVPRRDDNGDVVYDDNGDVVTDPGYFIANDETSLSSAFDDILMAIQSAGESFTAPTLSVDTQNRLTNRDDIYLAMFQPPNLTRPHWDGNLKKYRIGAANEAGPGSTPTIIDVNGNAIVNQDGEFNSGTRSYWSLAADEGNVDQGGFLDTMTANRKVVSNIVSGALNAPANRVVETNDSLTAALLQTTEARRAAVIRWARGVDDENNPQPVVGDPLHSAPTLIAYAGDQFALFFGTNDGFLHALNPEPEAAGVSDIEHFAFIPRELLPRLDLLARNDPAPFGTQRSYGMDGPITAWIDEDNNNQVVESGEKAYLYVGMRRGGRNYYALDVTDVDNPKLVWTAKGGTGQFAELGQTWSAPVVGRVRVANQVRDVVFFAGGNDTNQDAKNQPAQSDSMGRAIYMVDALSGERLWWASSTDNADLVLPQMTYSIPSDLRVIDTDQDGLDDRIYVGDTDARLWRIDIDDDGNFTGGLFADLDGVGESGNRKFYYRPSVTRIIDDEAGAFLTISIGSGHRAHPLEADVDDAFFMLRDPNPFAAPVDADGAIDYLPPIEVNDLLDVTNLADPTTDQLVNRDGWMIRFDNREKNLSAPLAVLNRVFFTTYTPGIPNINSCGPATVPGMGRLYAVDILSGRPVTYFDQPTPDDRYQELAQGGIPPSPTLVFTEPPCEACEPSEQEVSEITMLVGTEAFDPGIINRPVQTYWLQEDIDR